LIWVITDAAADLPAHLVEQYGIQVIGGKVTLAGATQRTGNDQIAGDYYAYWQEHGEPPGHADPSVNDIGQVYETILQQHQDAEILSIHPSGELTDTLQRARTAAAATGSSRIQVVDSQSSSLGLGIQVKEAAELVHKNRPAPHILQMLSQLRSTLRGYMLMESPDFLRRTGRLTTVDRMVGGLLGVKPIVLLDHGQITLHDQRRTRDDAIRALSESMIKTGLVHGGLRVGISHAICEADAHALAREISPVLKPESLVVSSFGPSNGILAGPGTLAAFWASPR
jgi:DegV family protein with EDD domain